LILSVSVLFGCYSGYNNNYKKIANSNFYLDKDLKGQFPDSIVLRCQHVDEKYNYTINPYCWCNLGKDTLSIIFEDSPSINDRIIFTISIVDSSFTTSYNEIGNLHVGCEFETIDQKLVISKNTKNIGDTIYGFIEYEGISSISDEKNQKWIVKFSTPFHCIIKSKTCSYGNIWAEKIIQQKLIENPDTLTSLSLAYADLDEIPQEIFSFPNLKILDLGYNNLDENDIVPLSKLKKLESLDLTDNRLSELPVNIDKFENLKIFCATQNKIKQINPNLFKLKNLQLLSLGLNDYIDFPRGISKLSNLEFLVLNDDLCYIPDDIKYLKKLKEIHLPTNLQSIPREILEIKSLETVFLSYYSYSKTKGIDSLLGRIKEVYVFIRNSEADQDTNALRKLPANVEFLTSP
jgi:Leucine-rich repeat (LRR) protein